PRDRAGARQRLDLGTHRAGPPRNCGVRPELRRCVDVRASGAPTEGEASRQALLPAAGSRDAGPSDLSHPRARIPVPHHGPDSGRPLVRPCVVQETLILSTCNRVEVYGVAEAPGEARAVVFRQLCRYRGVSHASVEPLLYTHVDDAAVHHAFRVAASLDSMLIGEPQILGQVKDAFALAQGCETVGPALHTLFTQAFAVGKKVRSETEIARHAVSVSFAAVELAKKIFAGLGGRAVLLVGAGKMGEL